MSQISNKNEQKTIEELLKSLDDSNSSGESQPLQNQQAAGQLESLEEEVKENTQEVQKMNGNSKQERFCASYEEFQELEESNHEIISGNLKLISSNKRSQESFDDSQSQEQFQEDLSEQNEQVSQLMEKITALEKENQVLKTENENLKKQNMKIAAKVIDLQYKLAESQKQCQKYRQEIRQALRKTQNAISKIRKLDLEQDKIKLQGKMFKYELQHKKSLKLNSFSKQLLAKNVDKNKKRRQYDTGLQMMRRLHERREKMRELKKKQEQEYKKIESKLQTTEFTYKNTINLYGNLISQLELQNQCHHKTIQNLNWGKKIQYIQNYLKELFSFNEQNEVDSTKPEKTEIQEQKEQTTQRKLIFQFFKQQMNKKEPRISQLKQIMSVIKGQKS